MPSFMPSTSNLIQEEDRKEKTKTSNPGISRRSFLGKSLAAGAGTFAAGRLLANVSPPIDVGITSGDVAILRFLSALEILEADLWQQYNELGGVQDDEVPGGSGNEDYTKAIEVLDEDMPQYIHDNTDDEYSHFKFINNYLVAKQASAVNLDQFRTLPSSQATGAQQIGRLTNLMQLIVDTSWWTRYRSDKKNPDFGDSFQQAIPGLSMGQFPAIPRNDGDLQPDDHLQAIANTAGFHFGSIEQGGSSLYPSLAQRVTSKEVLRILLSIGPTETMHFQIWHDTAGNAPPLTDPTNGLVFPDLNSTPFADGEDFETDLIMPEPTIFLDRKFPPCSIIRPTQTNGAAMAALRGLISSGLFLGQPQGFFSFMAQLARAADAAQPSTA